MGPAQIDDAVNKIFDLLNDGAQNDLYARKYLTDLLTDIYNEGILDERTMVLCSCPGYGSDEPTKCPSDCPWHGFGQEIKA
jgi:hypothetical protein